MALITIRLTDTFNSFISKTNEISTNLGDIDNLETGDASVVDALNTIKTLLAAFDDSEEITNLARSSFSVTDAGGDGSLSYNADNGTISYEGPSAAEVRAHFSAGDGLTLSGDGQFRINPLQITNDLIALDTITSDRFKDRVTLEIRNANGNVVKTIYSPGI